MAGAVGMADGIGIDAHGRAVAILGDRWRHAARAMAGCSLWRTSPPRNQLAVRQRPVALATNGSDSRCMQSARTLAIAGPATLVLNAAQAPVPDAGCT